MPKVGNKTFPYTKKGKEDAKAAAEMKGAKRAIVKKNKVKK